MWKVSPATLAKAGKSGAQYNVAGLTLMSRSGNETTYDRQGAAVLVSGSKVQEAYYALQEEKKRLTRLEDQLAILLAEGPYTRTVVRYKEEA